MSAFHLHPNRLADSRVVAGRIFAGRFAQEGEVIGYVGDTGNVVHGACHLHFAIWTVTDPKGYWDGENINPYPLLRPSP